MKPDLMEYDVLLRDIKERIRSAQTKAALSVNRELVLLYWQIGRDIITQQKTRGWGAKVIDRLAHDLHRSFPEMRGLSARNLKYMRMLAEVYPDDSLVQQLVALIPWGHNVRIMEIIKNPDEREWYLRQTIEHGWSRAVLVHQIESGFFYRQGKAVTNFKNTLPAPQSELAHQVLKDPYNFDFLTIQGDAAERDVERGLLDHLRAFLLELGVGFAFVGSQYHLPVGDQDFYIDLLFYHLRLRCFVVIELKMTEFKPEYAGKMNFYLSVLDDRLRHTGDQPSVGIILCKSRDKIVAEYSLRDIAKPIGVSGYRLIEALPKDLKGNLPTARELEAELQKRTPEGKP
jgi:predicted nuclease of restriction endonuclease-like (RecB) superfamily